MTAEIWSLIAAAGLVIIGAGFAAAETGISRISRVQVEEFRHHERPGAERLAQLIAAGRRTLLALQFLRIIAIVTATVLVTVQCDRHLSHTWEVILVAAATTALVSFVVVGLAGGTIGRERSESVALRSVVPVSVVLAILGPVPAFLERLSQYLVPGRHSRERTLTSQAELRDLVDQASHRQVIESGEQRMIQSVFDLGDTIVREVMVPRTDMVWIERGKTVRQALSLALRSGFSRIPVIGDNEDDVVGIVYLKDLARKSHEGAETERIDELTKPAHLVPDSKPVDELLREMQLSQRHLAIVIDEYGGTAGLVTIEDILEEIVGEIADEYDREGPRIEELDDGCVRVNVRVPIDDIEELFNVSFEVDDVDTVGGLMASALGRVPIPGTTVTMQSLTFVAESAKGRRHRVGTVVIRPDAIEDELPPTAKTSAKKKP